MKLPDLRVVPHVLYNKNIIDFRMKVDAAVLFLNENPLPETFKKMHMAVDSLLEALTTALK